MVDEKKPKIKFLDLYNPKRIKENWKKVQGSPYSSLRFQFMITRAIVIGLILVIVWQLTSLIFRYDGGGSAMTMVGRAAILLVMVLVAAKAWGMLAPLKKTLEHYEKSKQPGGVKTEYTNIKVGEVVDDILKNYDKDGKRIDKK